MPDPPIGGVHATELVAVHSLELETRRPGSWNNALVSGRPPAPTRSSRYFVLAKTSPPFQFTLGNGRVKTSTSTPRLLTPALVPLVHSPVNGLLSMSVPNRPSLQALMFSTTKLRPLNVFSWKLRNSWRKTATLMSIPLPLYFAPSSNASLVSGLNSRSSLSDATRPWHPV